jgi:hypothetical protein
MIYMRFCAIPLTCSVIRDSALGFHAKWLSVLRSHSLVTYSIGIFYFNMYSVELILCWL